MLNIGKYRLDSKQWTLTFNGATRRITARESAILAMLACHNGNIVELNELLNEIWGDDSYYNLRSLNVFVSHLRNYLNSDPNIEIQSIRGIGYRLIVKDNKSETPIQMRD